MIDRFLYPSHARIYAPSAPVAAAPGGVSIASLSLAADTRWDLQPLTSAERAALGLPQTGEYYRARLPGSGTDAPALWSVVCDVASNSYYVVVRPSTRTVAPSEALNRRCSPVLRLGVIELILQKVVLAPGQISTTEITNLIVQYIEQNLAGLKPRAQETFQLTWDADPELRTGGTAIGVTLVGTPAAGTIVDVYRGEGRLVEGADWTRAGAAITFLNGARPVTREGVPEVITVQYTPE